MNFIILRKQPLEPVLIERKVVSKHTQQSRQNSPLLAFESIIFEHRKNKFSLAKTRFHRIHHYTLHVDWLLRDVNYWRLLYLLP